MNLKRKATRAEVYQIEKQGQNNMRALRQAEEKRPRFVMLHHEVSGIPAPGGNGGCYKPFPINSLGLATGVQSEVHRFEFGNEARLTSPF
jgi:hypothetical protein